ncbi:hypothetical protein AB0H43_09870 [Hamadaea sp. NPDC050747]|uniref:hypothetical protein n=1 Tax=Hamadaea sp. NPDC050747 TaxID=3155789 RepID=UPI003404487E
MAPLLGIAPMCLNLVLLGRSWGPAAFVVRRGRFGVPVRWPVTAMLVAYLALMAGWWVENASRFGRAGWVPLMVGTAALTLALVAVVLPSVAAGVRGFAIALTPQGVVSGRPLGVVTIRWEAFAVGGLRLRDDALVWEPSDVVAPRGVGLVRPRAALPLRVADVDRRFVRDAIEFYVRHSERRAAIGSAEEHRRLFADLAEWYAAARPGSPVGR